MVRPAQTDDLPAILRVYEAARSYMRQTGNPTQWAGGYPQESLLLADIKKQQLYLCERENAICGAFVLAFGKEPTYQIIEDGAWKNNLPYATIHRVASDGTKRGVFAKCMQFCESKCGNLRVDTHPDNLVMQKLILSSGFCRCGIIHVDDGTPRIAYQKTVG